MRIYLFDFDNTIVTLPYEETIDYLDQKESLNPNLNFTPIVKTKNDYIKYCNYDPDGLFLLLSNRNFNVIEFRGQLGVSINAKGEYFLSRNTKKLKSQVENTFIVVGTYSRQYGKVIVNARVIDNVSGRIITSARSTFKHGKRNDCVIFRDCKPPRSIRIIQE